MAELDKNKWPSCDQCEFAQVTVVNFHPLRGTPLTPRQCIFASGMSDEQRALWTRYTDEGERVPLGPEPFWVTGRNICQIFASAGDEPMAYREGEPQDLSAERAARWQTQEFFFGKTDLLPRRPRQ